jgi:hypothetical protein
VVAPLRQAFDGGDALPPGRLPMLTTFDEQTRSLQ